MGIIQLSLLLVMLLSSSVAKKSSVNGSCSAIVCLRSAEKACVKWLVNVNGEWFWDLSNRNILKRNGKFVWTLMEALLFSFSQPLFGLFAHLRHFQGLV